MTTTALALARHPGAPDPGGPHRRGAGSRWLLWAVAVVMATVISVAAALLISHYVL